MPSSSTSDLPFTVDESIIAVINENFPDYEVEKEAYHLNNVHVLEAEQKDTHQRVCFKVTNKTNMKRSAIFRLREEARILKEVTEHPNIVTIFDWQETTDFIILLMEFLEGGSLLKAIDSSGPLSEKATVERVIKPLLNALVYLHGKDFVHRDIKPENLMMTSDSCKLIDFGFCAHIPNGITLSTRCGSHHCVAPEVLDQNPYRFAVDMWSVGVVAYAALSGCLPFYGQFAMSQIMRAEYEFNEEEWSKISKGAKDFISALLKKSPDSRLTAEQALSHPWLAS